MCLVSVLQEAPVLLWHCSRWTPISCLNCNQIQASKHLPPLRDNIWQTFEELPAHSQPQRMDKVSLQQAASTKCWGGTGLTVPLHSYSHTPPLASLSPSIPLAWWSVQPHGWCRFNLHQLGCRHGRHWDGTPAHCAHSPDAHPIHKPPTSPAVSWSISFLMRRLWITKTHADLSSARLHTAPEAQSQSSHAVLFCHMAALTKAVGRSSAKIQVTISNCSWLYPSSVIICHPK